MNLETEVKGLAVEKRAIVKFEEIEKQPKLIKGGQMKDYQARRICLVLIAVSPDRCSSSTGCPSWFGCITTVRWYSLRIVPRFYLA